MRAVVIVLVILGLAFVGLMVFSAARRGGEGPFADASGSAPPTRNGQVDEDALETWNPPNAAEVMARLFSPFAPRIGFPGEIEAPAGGALPARRQAPRGGDDMRVARVERVSGAPLRVSHDCADADDRQCPQVVCLCAPGVTYDEDAFDDCPESWTKGRRAGDDRLLCRDGDDAATLVIYREGGAIAFSGLGGASRAQVRAK